MNETLDLKEKVKNLIKKEESISAISSKLGIPIYKVVSINEEIENEINQKEDINIINEESLDEGITLSQEELDEHDRKGENLNINCLDCHTNIIFDKNEISEIIQAPSTKRFFGRLFGKLVCTSCQSPRLKFLDTKGKIIFDFRNFKICKICSDVITIPRLEKLNKTNVCILCADESNDYSKFHDRIANPINACPNCHAKTILFTNHLDNSKKIYCSKFTSKELENADDNYCNWSQNFITKKEINSMQRKYYSDLRLLRLKYAKKNVLHPQSLLTNSELSKLACIMPSNNEKLFSIPYKNNDFVKKISKEIIEIFKGR